MERTLPVVARNVRRFREAKGLSQAALGRAAGIAAAHVSMIESGRRADPQGSILQALARALGVTVDALLQERPAEVSVMEAVATMDEERGDQEAAKVARRAAKAVRREEPAE